MWLVVCGCDWKCGGLGDSVICGCGWQCGGCDWECGGCDWVTGGGGGGGRGVCGYESDRCD